MSEVEHTTVLCGAKVGGPMREALAHAALCPACRTIVEQDHAASSGPTPHSLLTRQAEVEQARERLGSYLEHLSNIRKSGRQVGLLVTAIAALERALFLESNGYAGYQFSNTTAVLSREGHTADTGVRALRHRAPSRMPPPSIIPPGRQE